MIADYLLHILTLMYQDGFRDYDEVQQEILDSLEGVWESLPGKTIETPHGTIKLLNPPNLRRPMEFSDERSTGDN